MASEYGIQHIYSQTLEYNHLFTSFLSLVTQKLNYW